MTMEPNDPLFPDQWFLENTGQSGGANDINVLPVWPDYTGKGIRVAIVDDGVQLDHPDLNVDKNNSWDAVKNEKGGGPVTAKQNHGTAVAGLVGELANNGIGGSGVAPDATLIAYRIDLSGEPSEVPDTAIAFEKALAANSDVVNNSWYNKAAFANNALNPNDARFYAALTALGHEGREGKGSLLLFCNGNDGAEGFQSMLDNNLNSKYVIAVGALDNNGQRTTYSTPGANLLISAPAGASTSQAPDRPGTGVLTTDRTSILGYNTRQGEAGDYAYNFDGTSAATPIVSGVVALMLQANKNLGYRDVQEILAHSAQFNDSGAKSWMPTQSGTWNGGGALFSTDYGFGEVDAHGAVRLAEVYPYLHDAPRSDSNALHGVTTSKEPQNFGPDGSATIQLDLSTAINLNHIDLTLFASIANVGLTTMTLTSPLGTEITLFNQPNNAAESAWPTTGFSLGTDAFWGEKGSGTWTLTVSAAEKSQGGTISTVQLDAYGDTPTSEKEFVYTDSFASTVAMASQQGYSRLGLAVAPDQTAVINAAAVSSDVTVDLHAHKAVIGGETISISSTTRVTKVFTGDGNDTLVGDDSSNLLLAGRGDNTIDGGGDTDLLILFGSRADYTATYNAAGEFTASKIAGGTSDTAIHVEKVQFDEGTGYVPAMSNTGLDVVGLYSGLLFRDPDASGYRYWTIEGSQGASASGIAASFLASTEFANNAGKLSNAAFVEGTYQHLLDRAVDPGGLAYWNNELASGALTRASVVLSIVHSQEYQTHQLVGVFETLDALGNLWG